jgi:hypothetical protein
LSIGGAAIREGSRQFLLTVSAGRASIGRWARGRRAVVRHACPMMRRCVVPLAPRRLRVPRGGGVYLGRAWSGHRVLVRVLRPKAKRRRGVPRPWARRRCAFCGGPRPPGLFVPNGHGKAPSCVPCAEARGKALLWLPGTEAGRDALAARALRRVLGVDA